jgi:2-iminoacetate synthase ThiH
VRQIVRHIADAGFIPAERDPYYNIKQYPDVQAILNEKPPVALPLA